MDDAFIHFSEMIDKVLTVDANFWDRGNEVHTYISEMEVGTPLELDIQVAADGSVSIGAVPPLYRVNTSFRPSYHSVTIRAIYNTANNDGTNISNDYSEQR